VYIVALAMVGVAALLFYKLQNFNCRREAVEEHGDSLYLKYSIDADRGDILAADGSLMTTLTSIFLICTWISKRKDCVKIYSERMLTALPITYHQKSIHLSAGHR
jgi:hypothetical protein